MPLQVVGSRKRQREEEKTDKGKELPQPKAKRSNKCFTEYDNIGYCEDHWHTILMRIPESPELFRNVLSHNIVSLLNGDGGIICFGARKTGTIYGETVGRKYEDSIRLEIDEVVKKIHPNLKPDKYRVTFTPIVSYRTSTSVHPYRCRSYSDSEPPPAEKQVLEIRVAPGERFQLFEDQDHKAYLRKDAVAYGPLTPHEIKRHTVQQLRAQILSQKEMATMLDVSKKQQQVASTNTESTGHQNVGTICNKVVDKNNREKQTATKTLSGDGHRELAKRAISKSRVPLSVKGKSTPSVSLSNTKWLSGISRELPVVVSSSSESDQEGPLPSVTTSHKKSWRENSLQRKGDDEQPPRPVKRIKIVRKNSSSSENDVPPSDKNQTSIVPSHESQVPDNDRVANNKRLTDNSTSDLATGICSGTHVNTVESQGKSTSTASSSSEQPTTTSTVSSANSSGANKLTTTQSSSVSSSNTTAMSSRAPSGQSLSERSKTKLSVVKNSEPQDKVDSTATKTKASSNKEDSTATKDKVPGSTPNKKEKNCKITTPQKTAKTGSVNVEERTRRLSSLRSASKKSRAVESAKPAMKDTSALIAKYSVNNINKRLADVRSAMDLVKTSITTHIPTTAIVTANKDDVAISKKLSDADISERLASIKSAAGLSKSSGTDRGTVSSGKADTSAARGGSVKPGKSAKNCKSNAAVQASVSKSASNGSEKSTLKKSSTDLATVTNSNFKTKTSSKLVSGKVSKEKVVLQSSNKESCSETLRSESVAATTRNSASGNDHVRCTGSSKNDCSSEKDVASALPHTKVGWSQAKPPHTVSSTKIQGGIGGKFKVKNGVIRNLPPPVMNNHLSNMQVPPRVIQPVTQAPIPLVPDQPNHKLGSGSSFHQHSSQVPFPITNQAPPYTHHPQSVGNRQVLPYTSHPQSVGNRQAPSYTSHPQSVGNRQAPSYTSHPQSVGNRQAPPYPLPQSVGNHQAPPYTSHPQSVGNRQALPYTPHPQSVDNHGTLHPQSIGNPASSRHYQQPPKVPYAQHSHYPPAASSQYIQYPAYNPYAQQTSSVDPGIDRYGSRIQTNHSGNRYYF